MPRSRPPVLTCDGDGIPTASGLVDPQVHKHGKRALARGLHQPTRLVLWGRGGGRGEGKGAGPNPRPSHYALGTQPPGRPRHPPADPPRPPGAGPRGPGGGRPGRWDRGGGGGGGGSGEANVPGPSSRPSYSALGTQLPGPPPCRPQCPAPGVSPSVSRPRQASDLSSPAELPSPTHVTAAILQGGALAFAALSGRVAGLDHVWQVRVAVAVGV